VLINLVYLIKIKDMKKFFASRFTQGNELFPTRICISNEGVAIREPGFFSGKERNISFRHISSVEIDCPFIGFSTIEIQTTGQELFSVHGFNSYEARQMKKLIMAKIQ
jgi:hypothetical protein